MSAINIQGIDHINLSVTNLERSIAFYRDLFGFDIREDHREDGQYTYVIMGAGQAAFLAIYEEADVAPPERPFISHWGFVVGPLEPVRERLQAAGVGWLYPERNGGILQWDRSRSMYIEDPDGHEIELVEVFGGGN